MKLYKIYQEVNNDYDTYDSAIVCADNEEEAKTICPDTDYIWKSGNWVYTDDETMIARDFLSWCDIKDVKVEYIGEAREGLEKGVVLYSFNAG